MDNENIKEILNKPKILRLSYGNYISLDDYAKLKDYIANLKEELQYQREAELEYNEKHIKLMQKYAELQQNYERIYNENCLLREKHNITDISLLDENNNLQQAIEVKNERIKEEQQEKERYIKFYNELNIWNKKLQQENERLRKELENISLDEANIRADILLEQEGSK